MVNWLTQVFLAVGGAVAGCFVTTDGPSFNVVQGVTAMLFIVGVVAAFALFPRRLSSVSERLTGGRRQDLTGPESSGR